MYRVYVLRVYGAVHHQTGSIGSTVHVVLQALYVFPISSSGQNKNVRDVTVAKHWIKLCTMQNSELQNWNTVIINIIAKKLNC